MQLIFTEPEVRGLPNEELASALLTAEQLSAELKTSVEYLKLETYKRTLPVYLETGDVISAIQKGSSEHDRVTGIIDFNEDPCLRIYPLVKDKTRYSGKPQLVHNPDTVKFVAKAANADLQLVPVAEPEA